MQIRSIALALLCALAVAAPAVAAPPKAEEREDKFVLENDHVSVWFQGKKPMLKVFPTANATEDGENVSGAYAYKFTEVVEFRDVDGDGAPSASEVVARLELGRANAWTVNRTEDNGSVVLNLTLQAPVKMGPKANGVPLPDPVDNVSLPDREARVGLVFTLRDGAATVQAGDVNVSVPATSVKYDFVVERWPFVDAAGNRLALVSHVEGALALEDESGGIEGAAVEGNGTSLGVLSWTTRAAGADAAGNPVDVVVRTSAQPGEGNATRLVHAYEGANLATLVHDPTIGVMPTEESLQESDAPGTDGRPANKVPAPQLLATFGAIGLALLLVARRRA